MKQALLLTMIGAILIAGCAKKEAPPPQQVQKEMTQAPPPSPAPQDAMPKLSGDTVVTSSGLKYVEITVGQGPMPIPGQNVRAHYTGWLTDGTRFDSSRDRGQPLEIGPNLPPVIKGMSEGLMTTKVGGRRLLIIPPELAYGTRGTPGGPIPPNATLVFDVEVLSATDPAAKL